MRTLEIHYTTSSFCRWRDWGTEWLSNLFKVNQIGTSRARPRAQAPLHYGDGCWVLSGFLRLQHPCHSSFSIITHLWPFQLTRITSETTPLTVCTTACKLIMYCFFSHVYISLLNYYYLSYLIYLPKHLFWNNSILQNSCKYSKNRVTNHPHLPGAEAFLSGLSMLKPGLSQTPQSGRLL